jgi:hypothetical protein
MIGRPNIRGRKSSWTDLPDLERKHLGPPIPTLRVEKVDPDATSCPTPSLKVARLVVSLGDDVLFGGVLVDSEVVGFLDMGVDDSDHLCQKER